MRRFYILALCAAALLLPMVAPLRAQTQEAPDPRLAKRITLDESEINLVDLTKKLTELSGIKFSVEPKPSAWSVRQRKVRIAAKDISIAELQAGLKKLLLYSWKRAGTEGAWEYVLYQSEVDRAREAKQRDQKLADKAQARAARVQRIGDHAKSVLSMTPQEAAKIKDSDPFGYLMATWPPAKAGARLLGSLPQGTFEQVAGGRKFRIAYSDLTPQMQTSLQTFANGLNDLTRTMNSSPNGPGASPPVLTNSDLQRAVLILEPPPAEAGPMAQMVPAVFRIEGTGQHMEMPLPEPGTAFANIMGKVAIGAVEGKDLATLKSEVMGQSMLGQLFTSLNSATPQIYSAEKLPKDPELLKEVEAPAGLATASLPEMIKKLSSDFKLRVVCDDYADAFSGGLFPFATMAPTGKMPLYKLLNGIFNTKFRTWSKEGPVILVQDPEWLVKRTWDVPDEWIAYFKEKYKAEDRLALDDMVRMAGFSEDQVSQTIGGQNELRSPARTVKQRYHALNFYGSLNASQKKQLQGKSGLRASRLSPKQFELAVAALDEISYAGDPQALLAEGLITCDLDLPSGDPLSMQITGADGNKQVCQLGIPKPTPPPAAPAPKADAPAKQ